MNMEIREQNIIKKAIQNFEEETGLKVLPQLYDNKRVDLVIMMKEYEITFTAEVIIYVNRARIGLVATKLKEIKGNPLLITEYINADLMDTIKEFGINFIDAAGNAFIKEPPLFINIKGNKLIKPFTKETKDTTVYAAGLQTIYPLLCNPGLEKNTVREIATKANVAVGTVHTTLKQLEKQGYLIKKENGQKELVNKEMLLRKWTTLYPDKLKQKYLIGRYETSEVDFGDNIEIRNYDGLWGGEVGANKLTGYIRPQLYTVYIGKKRGEFILRNRLKKNVKGNIELVTKFWGFEDIEYGELTHPILIYADLMATGDPRNIETANIIYEKYFDRYIR
jgi:hypothetical protein